MTSPRRTMPAFDTHKAVKALCGAGFNDAQAEAVVEQINGAVNENLASKEDLDRTGQSLRTAIASLPPSTAIASLATKEELRTAIAPLATKEELRNAIAPLATKEELRNAIAPLATKEELRTAIAQLELRMTVKMEELTGKLLRYMGGGMALVVALIKGLDLLTG